MKKRAIVVSLTMLGLLTGCAAATGSVDQSIREARSTLKDYALASCLIAIDPQNPLARDLAGMKRAHSFMGKGKYKIVQDQHTFETLSDPYVEAANFMIQQSERLVGVMKNGQRSKSYGCFQVYHSQAFEDLIAEQDHFMLLAEMK
ncbi:hypothetical protein RJD40_18380 [Vibrio scophthalmi]|uniref:hypothetical protein n=1 Tax=Vibrio scophthalmi TaxID=45658 RepID=UPI003AAB53ED